MKIFQDISQLMLSEYYLQNHSADFHSYTESPL